jgi:outer membrane protein assembly factor BamB
MLLACALIAGSSSALHSSPATAHVLVVIAESEYETATTIQEFAAARLGHGSSLAFTFIDAVDDERRSLFPIEPDAFPDLILLSVRRRALSPGDGPRLRSYLASGRPLVALRTSSHAFDSRSAESRPGFEDWPGFDAEVLGGNYQGHHGNRDPELPTLVRVVEAARTHPILAGLPETEWPVRSWLYKTSPLAADTEVLLVGRVSDRLPHEPVAWTRIVGGSRIFYTSLGHPDDFVDPAFERLLVQGIHWALERDVPPELIARLPSVPEALGADERDLGQGVSVASPIAAEPIVAESTRRARAGDVESGSWSHIHGASDGAGRLGSGSPIESASSDLDLHWTLRSSADDDFIVQPLTMPPLAASGRILVWLDGKIAALDAATGEIEWRLENADFDRWVPFRSGSAWAAAREFVAIAARNRFLIVDVRTGRRVLEIPAPGSASRSHEAGSVALVVPRPIESSASSHPATSSAAPTILLGSTTRPGATYTRSSRSVDPASFEIAGRRGRVVTGAAIFAFDLERGSLRWNRSSCAALLPTILTDGVRVYALAARDERSLALAGARRRLLDLCSHLDLIALGLIDGGEIWRRPVDLDSGVDAVRLCVVEDRVLLVELGTKSLVRCFSVGDGAPVWVSDGLEGAGDVDLDLERAVVAGRSLIIRPDSIRLSDGRLSPREVPIDGSGLLAASGPTIVVPGSVLRRFHVREDVDSIAGPSRVPARVVRGAVFAIPVGGGIFALGPDLRFEPREPEYREDESVEARRIQGAFLGPSRAGKRSASER